MMYRSLVVLAVLSGYVAAIPIGAQQSAGLITRSTPSSAPLPVALPIWKRASTTISELQQLTSDVATTRSAHNAAVDALRAAQNARADAAALATATRAERAAYRAWDLKQAQLAVHDAQAGLQKAVGEEAVRAAQMDLEAAQRHLDSARAAKNDDDEASFYENDGADGDDGAAADADAVARGIRRRADVTTGQVEQRVSAVAAAKAAHAAAAAALRTVRAANEGGDALASAQEAERTTLRAWDLEEAQLEVHDAQAGVGKAVGEEAVRAAQMDLEAAQRHLDSARAAKNDDDEASFYENDGADEGEDEDEAEFYEQDGTDDDH